MSYEASIVADSISPAGARITTFQLRFPRFLLAEFNTHRAFSRSARSSRAVPTSRLVEEVAYDPVMPICWGRNRPGMQAGVEVDPPEETAAIGEWLKARDSAIFRAKRFSLVGVHKQVVNRILEPFLWVDVVVTATSFDNFFALRCHPAAMPEMQKVAVMMARLYRDHEPTPLRRNRWHLPYVEQEHLDRLGELRRKRNQPGHTLDDELAVCDECLRLLWVSAARCARVSYKPFDSADADIDADLELADKLAASGHWSPFEHQARSLIDERYHSRNLIGWFQYREMLPVNVHKKFDFATLDRFGERDYILPA